MLPFVLILSVLGLPCALPQSIASDCSIITSSNLGNSTSSSATGLIAMALSSLGQGREINGVELVDYNLVCLVQGSVKDTYSMVSIIASYFLNGAEATTLNQFSFQCIEGIWSTDVAGSPENSVSKSSLVGNLSTPVRRDCRLCTDIGGEFSAAEHCVACSEACSGLGACTDFQETNCCNYFGLTGECVLECPANSTSNSNYQCTCNAGFMSNGSECIDINECSLEPCHNGGQCTNLINDYNCTCMPGFADENCSTNIDECSPNPCENGGNCSDLINDYSCSCVSGFTDKNCSTNIDECSPNPCVNGGDCTDLVNGYRCTCLSGYTNGNCSININDCSVNPCQNGGICRDLVDDYECDCKRGYSGQNCSTLIDNCLSSMCLNGGTCKDGKDDFSCICGEYWSGDSCEICTYPFCSDCTFNKENTTSCTKCYEGHSLDSLGQCRCNVENCLKCSDTGICEECLKSYKISDGGQSCDPEGSGSNNTVIIVVVIVFVVIFLIIIVFVAALIAFLWHNHKNNIENSVIFVKVTALTNPMEDLDEDQIDDVKQTKEETEV